MSDQSTNLAQEPHLCTDLVYIQFLLSKKEMTQTALIDAVKADLEVG